MAAAWEWPPPIIATRIRSGWVAANAGAASAATAVRLVILLANHIALIFGSSFAFPLIFQSFGAAFRHARDTIEASAVSVAEENAEAYRRQVRRILASQEFVTSRQLREFLQYVSEAALEGRTHVEQVEIAEKVLQRGKEFNPLDDASVRKLGTALRQRLDRFYETEGSNDPVRITLPVRSYIPIFEFRNGQAALEPLPVSPVPAAAPETRSRRWVIGGGLGAAAIGAGGWWYRHRPGESYPVFVIRTRQGDIMHRRNDAAEEAVLLGPPVGESDEVTTRLVFTPERATQQAGILIFGSADQYVKLGRQFLSRPQLEFGIESDGRYSKPPDTFSYDPDAQTGEPVWLSIRRHESEYRAFVSADGTRWRPHGNVLTMAKPMPNARAAIFAHNGRSDAPSAEARFDRLSVGISFHNLLEGPVDLEAFKGWKLRANSGSNPASRLDGECLAIEFASSEVPQSSDFVKTAPAGDWTFSTRLDFLSVSGSTAGLTAVGPKGRFRFIRWDLDGGSITAEFLGNRQVNRKDYEGAPPVVLRMTCRKGILRCSFSRDGRRFEDVPLEVPVAELTAKDLSIGLHTSTSSWKLGDPRPPARFAYLRHDIESLDPISRQR